jgi:hypothetical protein
MSEIDRVFARFRDGTSPAAERREVRSIPQRGTRGSRTVEVVHGRSAATNRRADQARQSSLGIGAAAWDDGFPARQAPAHPAALQPTVSTLPEPTVHVMPAWAPAAVESVAAVTEHEPAPLPRAAPPARRRVSSKPARHVADPFDPADDGANCLRCGYIVELARERRGLMTCAGCG